MVPAILLIEGTAIDLSLVSKVSVTYVNEQWTLRLFTGDRIELLSMPLEDVGINEAKAVLQRLINLKAGIGVDKQNFCFPLFMILHDARELVRDKL